MFLSKVKNPFFKVGRTALKWGKYTGLAMAGGAGVAAAQMFPDYGTVLAGALPPPFNIILMALLPAIGAGLIGAARNFQKNYTVTPDKLAELLAALEAGNTVNRYGLTAKELRELVEKAQKLVKR